MSERTPLLRVVNRRETSVRRYATVLLIGFILYCVYLVLFLPRTSYQRDWNHLHGNKFTRQEIERAIIKSSSNSSIHDYSQAFYLSGPHLAGEGALAEFTRSKFEEFGLETSVKRYPQAIAYPGRSSVKIHLLTQTIELDLEEAVVPEDPTSGHNDRIPAFHAYSKAGSVKGQVVPVGYGRSSDYDKLAEPIRGKIVLLKSRKTPLVAKLREAKVRGALAVLVYHDPTDDGLYTTENGYKAYPEGPARNPTSVERDTALDYLKQPGLVDEQNSIISLPISQDNARLLGLYPGHTVEVTSVQSTQEKNLVNVFGTIPGETREQVIIGSHRDSLTLGGAGGSPILLEVAQVLGSLYKRGWRPYRSIVFASWDGSHHGYLGSTAWAEDNRHKLRKRTAAYLDVTGYTGPEFVSKGSPLLRRLIRESSKRVPFLGTSLHDHWEDGVHEHAHVGTLGSGDFAGFYNFLGISSLSCEFQANATSHVFHSGSNYDTLNWQKRYGDVDFQGHLALARLYGILIEALVSTPVLPLRATEFGRLIQRQALIKLGERDEPEIQDLFSAIGDFLATSVEHDRYLDSLEAAYTQDYAWYNFWRKLKLGVLMRVANLGLLQLEDSALYRPGLSGRPWFRYSLVAPSAKTGQTEVLPGIAEALESRDQDDLFYWVQALTVTFRRMIQVID